MHRRMLCIIILLLGVSAWAESCLVRLGDYRNVPLPSLDITVTEAELQAEIDRMLSLHAAGDPSGQKPELTDTFAKEKLACGSAAEYRERLRRILEEEKAEGQDEQRKAVFFGALYELSEFSFSDAEIESEAEQMRSAYRQYASDFGLSYSAFCEEYFGIDEESFEAQLTEAAKTTIANRLMVEAIAAENNLIPDDETYAEKCRAFANAYGLTEEALFERYSEERLMSIFMEEAVWQKLTEGI